jgi:hypothetical protein
VNPDRIVTVLLEDEEIDINDFMRAHGTEQGYTNLRLTVESPNPSEPLKALVDMLRYYVAPTREDVVYAIERFNFAPYVGGKHVAAINKLTRQRELLITNPVDPDWN